MPSKNYPLDPSLITPISGRQFHVLSCYVLNADEVRLCGHFEDKRDQPVEISALRDGPRWNPQLNGFVNIAIMRGEIA